MLFFKIQRIIRQWLSFKPFHIHPVFKFYRRKFYCSHNNHATYPEAHFCIFCGKQLVPFPEWEITKLGHNPIVVSAVNERHAVQCAIEQIYNSRVDDALHHIFYVQNLKLKAFTDPKPIEVNENMILCAHVNLKKEGTLNET